jgi:hypothetical protein
MHLPLNYAEMEKKDVVVFRYGGTSRLPGVP